MTEIPSLTRSNEVAYFSSQAKSFLWSRTMFSNYGWKLKSFNIKKILPKRERLSVAPILSSLGYLLRSLRGKMVRERVSYDVFE